MRSVSHFARIPLAILLTGVGAGLVLITPAGADLPPDVAEACQAAFRDPVASEVHLVTDPPARSDARPGQEVHLDATWTPGSWESLSSVTACVRVNRVVDTALSSSEAPAFDDGSYSHVFAVPDGLFNGTAICTRIRLVGDPTGAATEAVWMGRQACFEVHPEEETPTTTSPTTAPTTSPSTAPPAAPNPTPAPTPAPVTPPSAPAPPPTGAVSAPGDVPLPRPAAPPAAELGTPGEGAAGGPDTPGTRVTEPETGTETLGPVALPILPRTGAGAGGLARTGLLALVVGVPVLAGGRRHRR